MGAKMPLPPQDEVFADWVKRLQLTCIIVTLVGDWYEIEKWCYIHSEAPWTRLFANRFVFESTQDAMMASLIWS
jgi:hypothetical protein